jgi:hypothetical protein
MVVRWFWHATTFQNLSPVHPRARIDVKYVPNAPNASDAKGFSWGHPIGTVRLVPVVLRSVESQPLHQQARGQG